MNLPNPEFLFAAPYILLGTLNLTRMRRFWGKQPYGSRYTNLLLLSSAIWSITEAMELLRPGISEKIFWDNTQWLGILLIPASFFLLVRDVTGRNRWNSLFEILLLGLLPTIMMLFVFTNHQHHLVVSDYQLVSLSGVLTLSETHSIIFWVFIGYSYFLLVAGFVQLLKFVRHSNLIFFSQLTWIIVASAVVALVSIADSFGLTESFILEPTVLALSFFVLVLTANLGNIQGVDSLRASRNILLESNPNPIILLDNTWQMIDINSAALNVFKSTKHSVFGKNIDDLIPNFSSTFNVNDQLNKKDRDDAKILVNSKYFNPIIRPNYDKVGRVHSHVLCLVEINGKETNFIADQRSQTMVHALSEVSKQVAAISTPQKVFDTMAAELKKNGLGFCLCYV